VGWTMFYLFVALKIPILLACWIVWWAVRSEPDLSEDVRDDGGIGKRPHAPPRLPHAPRRGPHGGAVPASPPRVRPVVKANGRRVKR
jgi:hypothetical protein